MSKPDDNALQALAKNFDALPDPVQTTFLAVVSRILGGLAATPAAWLRRPAQSFEDTTDARSIVARGLAQAVVEQAKGDPVTMQAAMEAYMPDTIRKVKNRAAAVGIAAEEISQSTDKGGDKAKSPDEDWMNAFIRFSEDASSERLQLLFGKILAGEVVNPGSFAPSTLRTVSELTQQVAQDFEWAWAQNIEDAIVKTPALNRGESWYRIVRLREAGFISPSDAVRFAPDFQPVLPGGLSPWMYGRQPHWLMVFLRKAGNTQVPVYPFTRAGMDLGKLLPPPNWEANLRGLAEVIPKGTVSHIDLYSGSKPGQRLWTAPTEPAPS